MNEIFEQFNNILKDKNIDLNQILGDEKSEETNTSSDFDFNFDLDTLLKFKNIFNKINDSNSPRNNLLNSLKPFLKDNKKYQLNQYIKIANLITAIESMEKKEESHKEINPDLALYVILILLIAK